MKHLHALVICTMAALVLSTAGCDDEGNNSNTSQTNTHPGDSTGNDPVVIDKEVIGCNPSNCSATCCGDVCRDTTSNVKHCGTCGNACSDDEICSDGKCVPDPYLEKNAVCFANEKKCNDVCTDIYNNDENCGDCGIVCLEGTYCKNGKCEQDCGRKVNCNGTCSDLLTDGNNCGACGNTCAENEFCTNAACSATCDDANQVVCNHACVDLTSDVANCGACGNACGAEETCIDGTCTATCPIADQLICNQVCVNYLSSNEHCGACDVACAGNAFCSNGVCVETCEGEKAVCNHLCVDLASNHDNCGECAHVCAAAEICSDGKCVCPESDPYCNVAKPTCDTDTTLCGISCIDTKSDRHNCGSCGNSCGENGNCVDGKCIDCTGKTTCSDGLCYDVQNDPNNCGGCGIKCPSNVACTAGTCSGCLSYYVDCDGDVTNGCETTSDKCECQNGETKSCYYGPAGTQGVGACKAGTITCKNNKWGECVGMVVPQITAECRYTNTSVANATNDLNCDGIVDGLEDYDKDGYTICNGDCCDTTLQEGCNVADPSKINPNIYETIGNHIDDNCNGVIDEAPKTCKATYTHGTDLTTVANRNAAGIQLAYAMDICDNASTDGYGLVSATVQSTSTSSPGDALLGNAINVFKYLAKSSTPTTPIISPLAGDTFAGMATGTFVSGNIRQSDRISTDYNNHVIPSDYFVAHGNTLQTASGCSTSTNIHDSVNLHLKLKAPANATGFSFSFRFYSHEYPQWVCSQFNDFFIALLNSKASGIPADKNIVFDKVGNPVSINNAFFTSCTPFTCTTNSNCKMSIYTNGCVSGKCSTINGACPDGTNDLFAFYNSSTEGGATAWLTTKAPVVGGETFTLDFYIWDTGDGNLNSAAIIDKFQWITTAGTVEVSTDFSDGRD